MLPQTYYFNPVVGLLNDDTKPLNAEQIAELERDPQAMLNKCVSTLQDTKARSDTLMSWDKDVLALCDSFMSHLQNKCFDFNNLLDYCGIDLILYDVDRTTQINCLENASYSASCSEYFSNSSGVSSSVSEMVNETNKLIAEAEKAGTE